MRCPRCQFENMPGLDRCFQCGSALHAEVGSIKVHPPRMAGWKRPIREWLRCLRNWNIFPQSFSRIGLPVWLHQWIGESYLGIFLSSIPGLAHLIRGQFRTIRIWIAVWAGLLFLALFFYGGFWGFIFLGFALGVHAWIACRAGFFQEHESLQSRMVGVVVVSIGLYILYVAVGRIVLSDIIGAYSGVLSPFYRIEVGDYLLSRRSLIETEKLHRGTLVVVNLRRVAGGNMYQNVGLHDVVQVCEIIALAGENLKIQKDRFYINDVELDPEKYPVPSWLINHDLSTTIPVDSYFIIAEFGGRRFRPEEIIRACTIPMQQIEAKAVLRWHPLHRRGWIRNME